MDNIGIQILMNIDELRSYIDFIKQKQIEEDSKIVVSWKVYEIYNGTPKHRVPKWVVEIFEESNERQ